MIKAVFYTENSRLSGFSLTGHAGCGTAGNDVACAAVSSAAELTCNTITDFFGDEAEVRVLENTLTLRLKNEGCGYSEKLLESFKAHLGFISEEYPRSIQIIVK
ncbi:ribosomal-processing cysteine protease Prp [Huintestinicola sp.]|uniref:ribosomal-processing cysteine protease Prp n=1 Tax=Huintestinicola sp. TaxID=2981661 RepID=UPI003D7CEB4F